jgi:hypothetical protein
VANNQIKVIARTKGFSNRPIITPPQHMKKTLVAMLNIKKRSSRASPRGFWISVGALAWCVNVGILDKPAKVRAKEAKKEDHSFP